MLKNWLHPSKGRAHNLSLTSKRKPSWRSCGSSEQITRTLSKLYAFAGLSFAADTQDQAAQTLQARVDLFAAEMSNRTLFFSLWWKELNDQDAKRLLDAAGDNRYYLEEIRHFKPHTLSEPEEKIINIKNVTGVSALNTLYDAITSRYMFKMEAGGETKELTAGELMAYRYSPDPDVRARSYQEQFRVYSADGPILGQMYQAVVRDWHNENLSLRKFPSAMAARNLSNDIPDEAVTVLLDAAQRNAGIFQRYFRLKGKYLGMEKLRRYDIYAPMSKSQKRFRVRGSSRNGVRCIPGVQPKSCRTGAAGVRREPPGQRNTQGQG